VAGFVLLAQTPPKPTQHLCIAYQRLFPPRVTLPEPENDHLFHLWQGFHLFACVKVVMAWCLSKEAYLSYFFLRLITVSSRIESPLDHHVSIGEAPNTESSVKEIILLKSVYDIFKCSNHRVCVFNFASYVDVKKLYLWRRAAALSSRLTGEISFMPCRTYRRSVRWIGLRIVNKISGKRPKISSANWTIVLQPIVLTSISKLHNQSVHDTNCALSLEILSLGRD
jgi:hypothetical protein